MSDGHQWIPEDIEILLPVGVAVAGGVDVDGDEEDVGGALGCADGVGAADAFFEGEY